MGPQFPLKARPRDRGGSLAGNNIVWALRPVHGGGIIVIEFVNDRLGANTSILHMHIQKDGLVAMTVDQ